MRDALNLSFILLSIMFQSAGGVLGKYAALTLGETLVFPFSVISNFFYSLSLLCLLLQALVWQQALMHYPLSFAYPFMSLVNFVILLSSAVLFGEGVTITNIVGLCLISIGITMLSRERGRSKIHGDVRS
jgi:multidrug transporter EmrE-like cation transporter